MAQITSDDLRATALAALAWVSNDYEGDVRLAFDFFMTQIDPPRDTDPRMIEGAFSEWLTFDAPLQSLRGATAFEAFTRDFAPSELERAARTEFLATVYVLEQDPASRSALVREEETRCDLVVHDSPALLEERALLGKTNLRLAQVDDRWCQAGWNVSRDVNRDIVPPEPSLHAFRTPRFNSLRMLRLTESLIGRNGQFRETVRNVVISQAAAHTADEKGR